MWMSIKSIHTPANLDEAWERHHNGGVFLGGGSYLVANADPMITELIHLTPLLDHTIATDAKTVTIGAGATLGDLHRSVKGDPAFADLATSIIHGCPSAHLRNQRTIGGELAQGRTDSDFFFFCLAADAQLSVWTGTPGTVSLRQWDGNGIVTSVSLSVENLIKSYRLAILPSTPPLLLVTVRQTPGGQEWFIGGTISEIWLDVHEITSQEEADTLAREVVERFPESPLANRETWIVWIRQALMELGGLE